jgi:hypothetical protein
MPVGRDNGGAGGDVAVEGDGGGAGAGRGSDVGMVVVVVTWPLTAMVGVLVGAAR